MLLGLCRPDLWLTGHALCQSKSGLVQEHQTSVHRWQQEAKHGGAAQVTGLAVSPNHPYVFSCGLDKMVKCWDMEYNKVIRQYHGHLSGVYSLSLNPDLSLVLTGKSCALCLCCSSESPVCVIVSPGQWSSAGTWRTTRSSASTMAT